MSQSRYQIIEPDEEETPDTSRFQIMEEPDDGQFHFGKELKRTGSALGDWFSNLPGRAGNAIVNDLNAAPSAIGGALTNPGRTIQNIGAGVADIGGNVLNQAAAMGNVDPTAARGNQEQPATIQNFEPGITKAYGLQEKQPGDVLVRGGVNAAPAIIPGVGLAKSVLGIGRVAKAGEELSRAEKAAELARSAHETAEAQEKAVQDEAKKSGVPISPEVVESNISKKEAALNNANNHIQALNHQLDNLPAAESSSAMQARSEAEHHLNGANELVRSSQLAAENADKQIQDYLQPLAAHETEAARKIKETHESNKREISRGYDALENDFENKDIKINDPDAIKNKMDEIRDFVKTNEARSPEATRLIQELEDLKSGKTTNAKDYLRAYRSVSQYAREARQKAYQRGMNAEERNEWQARTEELDKQVDEMGKKLEENVGGEDYARLKDLNSRWRKEVVPVEQNQTYRKIHRSGIISSNIVNTLKGTEPGNVLMQKMILNNPDIAKNIVGQQAKKVLEPNAYLRPYMEKLPELNRMIDYRDKVNTSLENAKSTLEKAQAQHKLASEAEKNQTENAGETSKKQEMLRKELGGYHDQVNQLQKELDAHRLHLEKLKNARNVKNQSLRQIDQTEKEYKAVKEKYDNTHSRLKKMIALTKTVAKSKLGVGIGVGAGIELASHGINWLTSPDEE